MRILLKSIVLIFGLISFDASATHLAGGDLQYEYISTDSSGNHTYHLKLRLYRDTTGVMLPNSATVYGCSPFYSTVSATLPLDTLNSGKVAPTMFDCVSASSAGVVIAVYYYEGDIIIPGNGVWSFSWSSCCRNPAIDNITNPGSQGFLIESILDNTNGQNSSPEFISEPVRAFCIGTKFNWVQDVIEPDGDSLYFSLAPVKAGTSVSCSQFSVPYDSNYTFLQPITTGPNDSLAIEHATGIISFTPTQVEVAVIGVEVEEYRWNGALQTWNLVGMVKRDMQVGIGSSCTSKAQSGIELDSSSFNVQWDSILNVPRMVVDCWSDSALALPFNFKLDCSTIASDGSDFGVYFSNGTQLSFDSVFVQCDVNNETVDLAIFMDSIFLNGTYVIYFQTGSDGDVVTNKCGYGPASGDTLCVLEINVPNIGAILGIDAGIYPGVTYPYLTLLESSDSTYWSISNGQIVAGQGTDTVYVKWAQSNTGSLSAWRYSPAGCGDTIMMSIQTIFGMEETVAPEIKLYPNPGNSIITIKVDVELKGATLQIIDPYGRIIHSVLDVPEIFLLDIENWARGLYFLQLSTSEFSYRERLILE